MRSAPVAAILVFALAGCRGKLVGTAALSGPGTADVSFTSTGKPLALWADTEGSWRGSAHSRLPVHYEIDVRSGKKALGHVRCDTNDGGTVICGSESNIFGEHSGDCEIELACELPAIPAGPASLHVVATTTATKVKKISLNVRAR